ncbi:ammonium transporter [Hyphomicrobium sp. CS1GBMeth3]|uniref:ammonium transporter n=1 Tax=Hyphomicrobium sp. CS1GBMeth3 TaxID=1892845 RepID=UPI0009302080|nr:ammonium transporter [Hyphomicrobium sp. CS1GBMeth3]
MKPSLLSRVTAGLSAVAAFTLTTLPALAQEAAAEAAPAAEAAKLDTGDTAWMLVSSVIVLMMAIPGLALFYGGMVRKKNVLNTVAMVFVAVALLSVIWMLIGYSLAFSDGGALNAYVGGLEKAMLAGVTKDALSGTIPETVFVFFQLTFFAITPALIVGSVVDRMKFSSLLVFVALWSLIVYAPVCHWVWGGGFLSEDGVLDFAGGTVVHINAGIAGLVAAIMLGKRKGYGTENLAPHNLVLTMIGASLLWVGWFGFNAGSAAAANDSAGMAALVTQICTAAAVLSWLIVEWIVHRKPTVLGASSGAIAGLVAITPAAGFVDPMGALIIGLVAGVVCYIFSTAVKRALGYDDSLDVFGVHGVGGIVGAVLTGVFAREAIGGTAGAIEGNVAQVWTQIYGVLATIIWCAVATFVILLLIKIFMGLRVPESEEVEGLDVSLHGEVVQ